MIIFFAAVEGSAYSQDVVVPADTEDIKAFDDALMKHNDQVKSKEASSNTDQSAKKKNANGKIYDDKKNGYTTSKEDEIKEEISKEAQKMKNLDSKSRKKIKDKIKENAQADAKKIEPTDSQNPAEVVTPPPQKGDATASPAFHK